MKCPECRGKGYINFIYYYNNKKGKLKCSFCYGKKELDWIEVILGVNKKSYFEEQQEEIIREYAKELSDQIDRDILKELGVKYAK